MSSTFSLAETLQEIESSEQQRRGPAMQILLIQARKDAGIYDQALPVFQKWVFAAPDPFTARCAAKGIELICGPEEGRRVWMALLNSENLDIVAGIAIATSDPSFGPVIVDLFRSRSETRVRSAMISALGFLKDPGTLPLLCEQVSRPEYRKEAIQSLYAMGDARAIPYLEPLLKDHTVMWAQGEYDNHAPAMRVSDVARDTISRLRK